METPKSCKIYYTKNVHSIDVPLSSSKSESNRVLIINALSGNPAEILNLSNARDTQTMARLLKSEDKLLDVLDAGTTMRFLTAYHAISSREVVLTGTERMQQRPIKVLTEALKTIGAKISFAKMDGYPPMTIQAFEGQINNTVEVRGDVSSQYISALLMIGPVLPNGLKIVLTSKVMSKPYITMTLALMQRFGIGYTWEENEITIPPQTYIPKSHTVESDWSGASYWFSVVALAESADITLLHLYQNSLQGDAQIVKIMDQLGVQTTFSENSIRLTKKEHANSIEYDFSHCPDLAQTVAVTCAAKNIKCRMSGLDSLRIKETDRIAALQNELAKINANMVEVEPGTCEITPGDYQNINEVSIKTYEDHRMAMAFAPLATKMNIIIEEPEVADKSYPTIWDHFSKAGFKIEEI